jgi:hypothetical protein
LDNLFITQSQEASFDFARHPKASIYYVSEDPGCGKTHAAMEHAAWLAGSGELVLITQPTIRLLNETHRHLSRVSRFGFRVKLIHSENSDNAVADIMAYISGGYKEDFSEGGHILLITQEALDRIPFFENAKAWNYICDEPPAVEESFTLAIPETKDLIYHRYLRDMFETTPIGNGYDLLTVSSTGRHLIEEMASNKNHDAIWKLLQPLAARIMAQHWTVYVRTGDGLLTGEDGQPNDRLIAYAVREPQFFTRFKTATVLGARLQDTLLFKHYERCGTRWAEDRTIGGKIRHRGQPNSDRVTILYAYRQRWSKNLRDRDGAERLTLYVAAVNARLKGCRFVWLGNKDIADSLFDDCGGTRLANSPHGLNDYMAYDAAVIVSALNPAPGHQHFLTSIIGANKDEIYTAIHKSTVYQAVTRMSVRDPSNINYKLIIVPDLDSAEWLQRQFPGSKVEWLGVVGGDQETNKGGRPRKPNAMTSTERSRACRLRQRLLSDHKAMHHGGDCERVLVE